MKKKNLRAMIVVMLMVFAMMPVTAGTVFAEEDSDVTVSIGVYDRTNKVCGQGGSYTLGAEDMTHTIDKHIMTKGASAQLTAAPDDGYEFVGWFMGQIVAGIDELQIRPIGNAGSTDPSGLFIAEEDVVLCAVFKDKNDTSTDTEPPVFNVSSLTVEISSGEKVATVGDTVTISIEITDASDLKNVVLYINPPESQDTKDPIPMVYNAKTGKWQWSATIDSLEQDTTGLYRILGFVAEDVSGNVSYLANSNVIEDSSVPAADLSAGDFTVAETFKVTFVDGQGNTLKTETVEKGKAAKPPANPTRKGFTFEGWDKDFSNITSDLTVTAQWKENAPAKPVSIQGAKVVLSAKAYTFNGKVRKPAIKTIGGKKLKSGTDYSVKWSNASSKNVGSYTVTITGKGNYTGKTKAKYRINPKGTALSKLVKGKKSVTVKWKKQFAKMAKKRITGYQIQLATDSKFKKNKKAVTVKGYSKASKKVSKLKGGKKYYVRIRTYTTVNGEKFYSPWSKAKTVTTKK